MIIILGTNNIVNELQQKNIDPNIVPTLGMTFKDIDDILMMHINFIKCMHMKLDFP
jgi:hypothetical protein